LTGENKYRSPLKYCYGIDPPPLLTKTALADLDKMIDKELDVLRPATPPKKPHWEMELAPVVAEHISKRKTTSNWDYDFFGSSLFNVTTSAASSFTIHTYGFALVIVFLSTLVMLVL